MIFEGELVISPYAQYFLWKNKLVSLQTQTCWGQHTETSLGEDMDIVFLAFKSNLTLHSVAFKIFLTAFAA